MGYPRRRIMKVLLVYCHPRKESLNYSIMKRSAEVFERLGHEVVVRDLYAMKFNPVLEGDDAIHIENNRFVRTNSNYPEDVKVEMNHILESDLLMYVYPVWWNGFPAMLKGYVDRVFQHGFAYSFESDTPRKNFAGKKAMFIHTTGQPQDTPEAKELTDRIISVTSGWMFNGNDVETLKHLVYGRVPYLSRDELSAILDDVEKEIVGICNTLI